MEIVNLPINKIKPDPNQPRQTVDQDKVKGMAQSIITEGVINPIEVDKNYIIITGEMRWRAATEAGLETIPCRIIEITAEDRFRRQVIENIHHNTMSDWDTAKALERLLKTPTIKRAPNDTGHAALARMLGIRHQAVAKFLGVLKDPQVVQDSVREGKFNASLAEEIRPVAEHFKERLVAKILADEYKTRDDVREVIRALKRNPELGDKILAAKTIAEVFVISPTAAQKIHESYNPVNELSGIVDKLVDWLKRNPPDSVGSVHATRVIFNLNGAVSSINKWGNQTIKLLNSEEKGN